MPLSRLDNFLKNVRGNILYVDPNNLDATDGIENQGNSIARPFKTLQRALIEAARFSYQRGQDNDRFEKTTIMLLPGEHTIDNRPGWIPTGTPGNPNTFLLRNGQTATDFPALSNTSDFNIFAKNNILYKFNSISGGIIIPRGVSIVGQDLRKTKIRPLYVPNPKNDSIERSSIFKVTGACYFFQFSIFDAKNKRGVYRDYTDNLATPTFSHHKLTCFEYADGVNPVNINDEFNTYTTSRTDLDMYYEKVGRAYGPASGREISPNFPDSNVDIQPRIDEYRIVGPIGGGVGISSIKAGDGNNPSATINVKTTAGIEGLNTDTNVIINNVTDPRYNGTFLVKEVLDTNSEGVTEFSYEVPVAPNNALPNPLGSSIDLSTDTVTSASPYVFNISLRSIFGMCGMHADGSKATGFKSMVVAQFTGISLQVDDNAFVKYNSSSGTFDDSTTVPNLHTDINAVYKPSYENFHIKASNNGLMQLVSIFAIGFSDQFVVDSGGDFSVTNSNSNFGQIALKSTGFRKDAFSQDDVGYVTQIIPPKTLKPSNSTIEFPAIDITKTVGVGNASRMYLYQYQSQDVKPPSIVQGYRFGARHDEKLYAVIPAGGVPTSFEARVIMDDTATAISKPTAYKRSVVGRNVSSGNSITSSTLTFLENHQFSQGESIRVVANNGRLPDGLESNRLYYAIVDGLNPDQLRVAQSINDSQTASNVQVNNLGGTLYVESRVSDKTPGDPGHPIQYDDAESQWFVNVSSATTENSLYPKLQLGGLGQSSPRTYIVRQIDSRQSDDRIHKFRYVIPANTGITSARPPLDGFTIEESGDVSGANDTEVAFAFNPASVELNNDAQMRNFSFVAKTSYTNGVAFYDTERPHGLSIGSSVEINGVRSTNFPTVGAGQSGYNGVYSVSGITSEKTFFVNDIPSSPGAFINNTSQRNTSLPTFKRKTFSENYYVYDVETVNEYVNGEQDGIYYISVLNASNTPDVSPFNTPEYSLSQPLQDYYPQIDRDNPKSSVQSTKSYALPTNIGRVVVNDPKMSITQETLFNFFKDSGVGVALTDIVSNPVGTGYTIYTQHDHGLNKIARANVDNGGSGYGDGTATIQYYYNARLENTQPGSIGRFATARVTVDGTSAGEIVDCEIMDGGSAFVNGDICRITGITTTTGFTFATVSVDRIRENLGNTIQVTGIGDYSGRSYNKLYRINGVTGTKQLDVTPVNESPGIATEGLGLNVARDGSFSVIGPTYNALRAPVDRGFEYDHVSGIATITTQQNNNIRVNNTVIVSNAVSDFYNGEYVCVDKIGLTTVVLNVGIQTLTFPYNNGILLHPGGYDTNFGDYVDENGRLHGRETQIYAGISTVLFQPINSKTTDTISIENMADFDFKIGDYLRVNDELMRIKQTVSRVSTDTTVKVFRGVYGSVANTHATGSVINRVKFYPLEFRRNSIIRASGHTFEYIGYGPGNYSTAFPDRQTRQLSLAEQINVQSMKIAGGVVNYTGMNDRGDFFIGNKRIASNTGREQVYDTPVQTVCGEDPYSSGSVSDTSDFNFVDSSILKVERNMVIDGGDKGDILSEFNGPVSFSKKIVSTSPEGVEANSLFIQGNAQVSRKMTVGISTPTEAGTPGDIVYNANPTNGGTVGWVYTTGNTWKTFGAIDS